MYPQGGSMHVKVERAGDLAYVTYFMVNWNEEKASPAEQRCAQCGSNMVRLEASVGEGKESYEGIVCHGCKRLTWVRKS